MPSTARVQMVDQQVRGWDVLDSRVLEILRAVPREAYVDPAHRYLAFADIEIPLPSGQHMLRPNVVGRLLQSLELTGTERVLEIGTGSGFVTACLAAASSTVRSLEIFSEMAERARSLLASNGVRNVEVAAADAMQLESAARYHAIALTASLPIYDERFQRLLEVGGRLFVVVGNAPIQEARLVRRTSETGWETTSLFETLIDPLLNAESPTKFSF